MSISNFKFFILCRIHLAHTFLRRILQMSFSQHRWRDSQMANQMSRSNGRNKEQDEEMQKMIKEETEKLKRDLGTKRDRIKELENELVLSESQFARAVADSEAASSRANSKDKDMTELMKSIQEIQSQAGKREEEANRQRREAERKVSELEKGLAVTKGELNVFNHERSTLKDTLDSAKQERLEALKKLDDTKLAVDDLKSDLNSTMSQLTLEKELRSRSEQKEREERNERIALSAQMVAMTKEHAHMESTMTESKDVMDEKWRNQIQAETTKLNDKQKELNKANERIVGLQGEIQVLKLALKDEKNAAHAENAEEMGRLASELEILKDRLRTEENRSKELGMTSENQVAELEKTIREGQSERRKMHNLIQELRGNVRVFARIRPFLPGDGVGDDEPAMCVPKSETALKLVSTWCFSLFELSLVSYNLLISPLYFNRQQASRIRRATPSVSIEFLDPVLGKRLCFSKFRSLSSLLLMDTMSVFSLMVRQVQERHIPCRVPEMVRCVVSFPVQLSKLVNIKNTSRKMDGSMKCKYHLLKSTTSLFVIC